MKYLVPAGIRFAMYHLDANTVPAWRMIWCLSHFSPLIFIIVLTCDPKKWPVIGSPLASKILSSLNRFTTAWYFMRQYFEDYTCWHSIIGDEEAVSIYFISRSWNHRRHKAMMASILPRLQHIDEWYNYCFMPASDFCHASVLLDCAYLSDAGASFIAFGVI